MAPAPSKKFEPSFDNALPHSSSASRLATPSHFSLFTLGLPEIEGVAAILLNPPHYSRSPTLSRPPYFLSFIIDS